MYPDLNFDIVLFELENRRSEAAMHRLAREFRRSRPAIADRLRWAVGSALVRLGGAVAGEEARRYFKAPSGG